MTIEEIRRHAATPFQPFSINLADGRKFPVVSPEFLAQSVGGRTIYVSTAEGLEIIDLFLVVSLTVDEKSRNGRGRRRSA